MGYAWFLVSDSTPRPLTAWSKRAKVSQWQDPHSTLSNNLSLNLKVYTRTRNKYWFSLQHKALDIYGHALTIWQYSTKLTKAFK